MNFNINEDKMHILMWRNKLPLQQNNHLKTTSDSCLCLKNEIGDPHFLLLKSD